MTLCLCLRLSRTSTHVISTCLDTTLAQAQPLYSVGPFGSQGKLSAAIMGCGGSLEAAPTETIPEKA